MQTGLHRPGQAPLCSSTGSESWAPTAAGSSPLDRRQHQQPAGACRHSSSSSSSSLLKHAEHDPACSHLESRISVCATFLAASARAAALGAAQRWNRHPHSRLPGATASLSCRGVPARPWQLSAGGRASADIAPWGGALCRRGCVTAGAGAPTQVPLHPGQASAQLPQRHCSKAAALSLATGPDLSSRRDARCPPHLPAVCLLAMSFRLP